MRRPLFLTGFMASGKSTVGKLVAERSGHSFLDLDQEVERKAGCSVKELFANRGEAAFRELERATLTDLISHWASRYDRAPIIALGGGALLRRPERLAALRAGVVIALQASAETLTERASQDDTRPLLSGHDPEQRVRQLLSERALTYAESNAKLTTDGQSPEQLADQAIESWRHDSIAVAAGERSYVVQIGASILSEHLPGLVANASKLLAVSDKTVAKLHLDPLKETLRSAGHEPVLCLLEPGERSKTVHGIEALWRAAYDAELDRKACFVALGGGVVTDMTGFAAATWLRGVSWVALPTTLLAMVDASVGGKTGVDFDQAKNSVGAFWQPRGVVCDVELLKTESDRAYKGALAEVIKTALIGDPDLFELLENNPVQALARDLGMLEEMVRRSIAVKAWVVGSDEREAGLRATLNLGHTIGHALEAQGGYERLTHGEAVSLGLVAALRLGVVFQVTPRGLEQRVTALLAALGLPTALENEPLAEAAQLVGRDKKRKADQIGFIFAKALGDIAIHPLPVEDVVRETQRLARH